MDMDDADLFSHFGTQPAACPAASQARARPYHSTRASQGKGKGKGKGKGL